jgi:hypothetical protein
VCGGGGVTKSSWLVHKARSCQVPRSPVKGALVPGLGNNVGGYKQQNRKKGVYRGFKRRVGQSFYFLTLELLL